MNKLQIGRPVPSWELESIFDDEIPTIDSFTGKPLLILFFYLDCPGCKGRAIPFANLLIYEKKGIQVIGIHSRFEGQEFNATDLRNAKEEFNIRFPIFMDQNGKNTFEKYEAGGTPHWILLDKDGNLAYSIFGSAPNNALLKLELKIQELFQEAQKEQY